MHVEWTGRADKGKEKWMRLTEADDNVTIFQIAMSRHARDARSMKTFWMMQMIFTNI